MSLLRSFQVLSKQMLCRIQCRQTQKTGMKPALCPNSLIMMLQQHVSIQVQTRTGAIRCDAVEQDAHSPPPPPPPEGKLVHRVIVPSKN